MSQDQAGNFQLASRVRSFINQDGAVLLNTRTGKYYGLNAIGGRICAELRESSASEERIASLIASEYGVDFSTAANDVSSFLHQLEAYRLVERDA